MKHIFYSDPAHGWIKVKISKLKELGIEDKITSYSYMRKDYVYLEEDYDAGIFIKALEENGEKFTYDHRLSDKRSKIRSYESYKNK